MSRFNQTTTAAPQVTNLAGGTAYAQSPEMELASILLTSFATDQFYQTANDTFTRLKQLIQTCDKKFVAQAAVYARTVFGMRSITHCVASELAKHIGGEPWAKAFFAAIVYRPDDMLEILSYHKVNNGKIPNSMKKGFALAFDKFDRYQLAKYRGEGKEFKLIDVVNLVHPTPTGKNADAISALVKGELKALNTWESELSKAGQGETDEDVATLKEEAWVKLVREKKMGYLGLLRNLRNIMEQAPAVLKEALAALTDEAWIKKSLIFPFQYLTAYKQFEQRSSQEARLITDALARAVDISCQNIKYLGLDGNTLVAIDNSGSMDSLVANSKHMKKAELGALFGIVFAKGINGDIITFGDYAKYVPFNLSENAMQFAANFHRNHHVGHGTAFSAIFDAANKKYDRILIFSDMQSWSGYGTAQAFAQYEKKQGINTKLYLFDLAGHGTMQFPEDSVFCLSGYSDKIFDLMKMLEVDKKALINTIKKIWF